MMAGTWMTSFKINSREIHDHKLFNQCSCRMGVQLQNFQYKFMRARGKIYIIRQTLILFCTKRKLEGNLNTFKRKNYM